MSSNDQEELGKDGTARSGYARVGPPEKHLEELDQAPDPAVETFWAFSNQRLVVLLASKGLIPDLVKIFQAKAGGAWRKHGCVANGSHLKSGEADDIDNTRSAQGRRIAKFCGVAIAYEQSSGTTFLHPNQLASLMSRRMLVFSAYNLFYYLIKTSDSTDMRSWSSELLLWRGPFQQLWRPHTSGIIQGLWSCTSTTLHIPHHRVDQVLLASYSGLPRKCHEELAMGVCALGVEHTLRNILLPKRNRTSEPWAV